MEGILIQKMEIDWKEIVIDSVSSFENNKWNKEAHNANFVFSLKSIEVRIQSRL